MKRRSYIAYHPLYKLQAHGKNEVRAVAIMRTRIEGIGCGEHNVEWKKVTRCICNVVSAAAFLPFSDRINWRTRNQKTHRSCNFQCVMSAPLQKNVQKFHTRTLFLLSLKGKIISLILHYRADSQFLWETNILQNKRNKGVSATG